MTRVSRSAHLWALRLSTLTLCFVLVLAGIPLNANVKGRQNDNQDGPRTKGAPGPNLPNLDEARAAGASNEKQPDIKLPAPVAATRCRHQDKKCKETKERRTSLTPAYDRFSNLWAYQRTPEQMFGWKATTDNNLFQALNLLPRTYSDSAPALPPSAAMYERDASAAPPLLEKPDKRSSRAAASSFSPAIQQVSFETALADEINRMGGASEDLYSGNYHWSTPLVSLPGRAGLDLNLTLCYNSLVWTKSLSAIRFDASNVYAGNNSPSPGFHLGFPSFSSPYTNTQTGLASFLMFTPSGRAVEMRYVSTGLYEARDGSFAQLKINTGNMVLTTDDGTCYTYYGQTSLEIKDRNGNKIAVTMNAAGDYQSITDTLGRVINFNYGSFNDLQTITQTWDGMTKTLASFSYDNNFQISTNFSSPITLNNITNGTYVPVIYQIDLLDGTRYNFQYNSYGQICRIDRKGANNNLRSWTTYNLPANAAAGAQSDCPRFTKRTDWALDWSTANGYDTNFCFSNSTCPWSDTHNVGKVTTPDGTTQVTLFSNGGWQRGLPIQTETWSAGVRQKWTIPLWEQPNGFTLYQCNPRVYESSVYDKDGNRRRVTIQYNANDYNRPGTICEYNADATTLLRKTVNAYTSYLNTVNPNRILGLPTQQCLYDGSNALQSKVEYRYDEGTLATFPNTPICYTSPDSSSARGNLTSVRRYDINAPTQYVENKIVYYITGAPSCTKDALNHATTFIYDGNYLTDTGATQLNNNTYAYPTHITDPDGYATDICYSFVRGDVRRTVDPKGAIVRRDYDGMGRLWKVTNENNSAFTCYNFDPNSNYVQSYTTILDSAISNMSDQFYSITVFDGHGRVRTVASDHPGSSSNFKAQYNGYDNMGRLAQQSNWTEINGSTWNPAGDDVAGWAWTYQFYDWQGRPTLTQLPDHDPNNPDPAKRKWRERLLSYTGCGCAGGQTVTICDEGQVDNADATLRQRRKQQITYDVLGRPFKTQTFKWDGNVYSTAFNTYNVRDQITCVKEYSGTATGAEACPSATCQKTDLSYDGHGRLYQRKLPIENAATTFSYFADDMAQTITDARGASVTYGYNNRHLATSLTYGVPSGVEPTPNVTIGYDAAGNRTLMQDGLGQVDYLYDTLSRMTEEKRTFSASFGTYYPALPGTYKLTYQYNLAGQVTHLGYESSYYPADNSYVDYAYDKSGQMTALTGMPFAGVSTYSNSMCYFAPGNLKSLSYGNNYTLSVTRTVRQQVQSLQYKPPSGTAKLDKTYTYYPDGRIKFSDDALQQDFDRAFRYDDVGKLAEGWTGQQARNYVNNQPIGTSVVPYHFTYQYDAWGNETSQTGKMWSNLDVNETATFTNQRRSGWGYDAAGNVTNEGGISLKYDAAGRNTSIPYSFAIDEIQQYDGDGLAVRRDPATVEPTFYLRSSVLGGAVIVEINGQGTNVIGMVPRGGKLRSHIYNGALRVATQIFTLPSPMLIWRFIEPITGTEVTSDANNVVTPPLSEPDPEGIHVSLFDPASVPPPPPDPEQPSYSTTSSNWNPVRPTYTVDGIRVDEAFVMEMFSSNSMAVAPADEYITIVRNGRSQLARWQAIAIIHIRIIHWLTRAFSDTSHKTNPPRHPAPRQSSVASSNARATNDRASVRGRAARRSQRT